MIDLESVLFTLFVICPAAIGYLIIFLALIYPWAKRYKGGK